MLFISGLTRLARALTIGAPGFLSLRLNVLVSARAIAADFGGGFTGRRLASADCRTQTGAGSVFAPRRRAHRENRAAGLLISREGRLSDSTDRSRKKVFQNTDTCREIRSRNR